MPKSKRVINQLFFSFLVRLTIVTLGLAVIFIALLKFFPEIPVPSHAISIFTVLYGITAGIHYILLRTGRGEPQRFASFIILSVVMKLFLYAIFTFLLIVSDRAGAMENVVLFFILYIVLTVLEIGIIYHQINRLNDDRK